uniref:Cytokinin riboside 5'-monophosphate phosphoribohydrolase n=1 Tax=Candidatus Kentrum sp. FW TaxID=2126338 RepID=A0A450RZ85_9GAMM|nr:MAG: hypothetical protein BECKFW1821A_GA0114235_100725 [Candidatus Kentron sp. FW]
MGSVADGVLQAGGIAIGIVPTIFSEEIIQEGLSELYRVSSMHARKEMMCSLSDGFVALPGRYGTLEEIIEMTTWAQLGLHGHPCGLLNIANYFDGLLSLLDRGVSEGFIDLKYREMLLVSDTPKGILQLIADYESPVSPRHMGHWANANG